MPLAQDIYNSLLEDPNLEIGENQTREEAAQIEAEQRARQYMNNVQALALAAEPLNNSALKQLFNFLKTPVKKISKPIEKITKVITKELVSSGDNLKAAVHTHLTSEYQHFRNLSDKFGTNGKAFFNALIEAKAEPTVLARYISGMLATGEDNIEEDEWPMEEVHQLQTDSDYKSELGISDGDLNLFNEQLQRHAPFRDFVPKEAIRTEEAGEIGDIIHELRHGNMENKSTLRGKIKDNMRNLTNYPKEAFDDDFDEWAGKVVSGLKAMHFFNEALRSKDGTVSEDPDHFSYTELKRDFTDSFETFEDYYDTENTFYNFLRDLITPDEDGKIAEPWLAEMQEDREFPLLGADRETGFYLNSTGDTKKLEKQLKNLSYALKGFEDTFFKGDIDESNYPSGRDWMKGLRDELAGWKDLPSETPQESGLHDLTPYLNTMQTPAPTGFDGLKIGPYHKALYEQLGTGVEFHKNLQDTLNKLGQDGWSASALNELMTSDESGIFGGYPLKDFGLVGQSIELPKNAIKQKIPSEGADVVAFMAPSKEQLEEELSKINGQIKTAYQNKTANVDAGAAESQLRMDEAALTKAKNALSNIVNKMQIHNDQVKNNPEQLLSHYMLSRENWENANESATKLTLPPYDWDDAEINNPEIYSYRDLVDRVIKDLGDTQGADTFESLQVFEHLDDNKIDSVSLDDFDGQVREDTKPIEPTEELDELPIEPTEEPEMPEKTAEPKLDEGKLNELMDYYDFEQNDPKAQKLLDHYKNNPKKLDSDYEKNIIGNIISDKLESNKKISQEAETKEAEEIKAKQDKANSLPHEKGHLDEYKNEDEEVSSIQATKHARELVAHYLEHKEDMSDDVRKQHGEALAEAFNHGADYDRLAKEMKDYGEDFGSPEFYEDVEDMDIQLSDNHQSRNEKVTNPNHGHLRDAMENPNKLMPAYDGQLRSASIEAYNDSVKEIQDLGLDGDVGELDDIDKFNAVNAIKRHKKAIAGLEGIIPKEKLKDLTSHLSDFDGGETEEEKEQRELEIRMAAEGRVKNPKTGRWVKKENLDALIRGFDTHDFGVVNGNHAGKDGSALITDNDGNGVDEHYQIGKDGLVHFIDESSLSNAPSKTGDNVMSGQEFHGKVLGQKHKSVIGEMKENKKSLHVTPNGFANDNTPHGDASKKLVASTPPTPTRTQGTFNSLERYMSKQITSVDSLINFVKDKDTHEKFKNRKRAKELLERVSREKSE
jgi:hypothetical protein